MLQVLILPLFLGTLPFMPTPSHPNPRTSPGTHARRPDGGGRPRLWSEGNFSTDGITSLFGNHEQFGSFLVLLLPLGLALDRG